MTCNFTVNFESNFMEIHNGLIHLHYWDNDKQSVDGHTFKNLIDLKVFYEKMEESNLKITYKNHIVYLEQFYQEIQTLFGDGLQ